MVRVGRYLDYAAGMFGRVTVGLSIGKAEADAAVIARAILAREIIEADLKIHVRAFMRQALFRKGDDRRGLIGVKLEALSRNSNLMQSGEVIG